jgi:hypothetical protein
LVSGKLGNGRVSRGRSVAPRSRQGWDRPGRPAGRIWKDRLVPFYPAPWPMSKKTGPIPLDAPAHPSRERGHGRAFQGGAGWPGHPVSRGTGQDQPGHPGFSRGGLARFPLAGSRPGRIPAAGAHPPPMAVYGGQRLGIAPRAASGPAGRRVWRNIWSCRRVLPYLGFFCLQTDWPGAGSWNRPRPVHPRTPSGWLGHVRLPGTAPRLRHQGVNVWPVPGSIPSKLVLGYAAMPMAAQQSARTMWPENAIAPASGLNGAAFGLARVASKHYFRGIMMTGSFTSAASQSN